MDKSNGAKCLRARRGSASSKDEPKAQKHLLAPREKGKGTRMKFQKQLKIANKYKINCIDLSVATACKNTFEFKYTNKEFEELCLLVKEAFIEYEESLPIGSFATYINILICDGYTVHDVLLLTVKEFISMYPY